RGSTAAIGRVECSCSQPGAPTSPGCAATWPPCAVGGSPKRVSNGAGVTTPDPAPPSHGVKVRPTPLDPPPDSRGGWSPAWPPRWNVGAQPYSSTARLV